MSSRLLLAAALLSTAPAAAGGFGIPEIGVKRTAMSTVIGRPDDPSAIYHNPAGISLLHGTRLYLSMGLSLIDTEFHLRPWTDTLGSGETRTSDDFLGTSPDAEGYYPTVKPSRAMAVIPMIAATFETIPDKLWLGGGLYVGNATGAAFDEDAVTRYHLVDGYIIAPQAVVTAAYKLAPTLTLGVTAGIMNLRVHGKRYFYPVVRMSDGTASDISGIVGKSPLLELDGEAWAPTWIAGAFGHPHPRVTWGATITGRTDATLEGPVKVTYSDDVPPDTLIGTQQTTQLLPWAFMAGAAVDATDKLEVDGEFRYWLYRQYEKQHTEITGIFLVRELETQKNYKDSYEASIGVRAHDLAFAPALDLMAGFNFDKSPAPPQTVTLDQPSFTHFGLHAGARYSFGRYRVGASYVFYHYFIPTIEDSITSPPSNIRGRGTNNFFTASLEVTL